MLAFDDIGAGPQAIVFLPGVTCSREHWRPVADLLAADHRCVLIDPPGHGGSLGGGLDVLEQLAPIHEVVTHLGLERPLFVGHSAGGITATVYAVAFPTIGVIDVEGTLDLTGEFAQTVFANRDLLRNPETFAEGFANVIAPMRIDLIPRERRAWAQARIGAQHDTVVPMWRGLLAGEGAEITERLRAVLPSLAVPLLTLWGEPVTDGERAMAELAPQGSTASWPGLGHFVHLVDPERTAARIASFAAAAANR